MMGHTDRSAGEKQGERSLGVARLALNRDARVSTESQQNVDARRICNVAFQKT